MKTWERLLITLMLCLTILVAVWLHGTLNRYEVVLNETGPNAAMTRYDHITGRIWHISGLMGEMSEISGFDSSLGTTWEQVRKGNK